MIEVIYGPQWFHGSDIVIDIVSIFVLLLIAYFGVSYYKLNNNKNYLFLATSFFLLALSFVFKNLLNLGVYYHILQTNQNGFAILSEQAAQNLNTMFLVGILLYRLLTVIGLYILYNIYNKQSKETVFLVSYLLLVLTYFSQSNYYIFHLTSLVLLALIVASYSEKYLTKRDVGTILVVISFSIIALSQLFFIFVDFVDDFYVFGEVVQLVGYIALLTAFVKVFFDVKKANKNGHNR